MMMRATESMTSRSLREMTIEEVRRIPATRLQELYEVVHSYRIGLGASSERSASAIEEFSGAWAGVPEEEFEGFLAEVRTRRQAAFGGRDRP